MTFSAKSRELIKEQILEWELAANNYKGIAKVRTKMLQLPGGCNVKVQFNSGRINSSAAKVDAKSIQERPCFLCRQNRPEQQRGLSFGNEYTVLVNPFPIFPEHLTIPLNTHSDQIIKKHFAAMLNLAKALNDFTVFYNGPKCGASAPDHFHFQAGIKGFMPVEADFREGGFTQLAGEINGVKLFSWHNYHRNIISMEGRSSIEISEIFEQAHKLLSALEPAEVEPKFNILAYSENSKLIVHLFPRILHRPDYYFAKGMDQIIISPASVDMGGVFITPREEDFEKITAKNVAAILKQVCIDEQTTQKIIDTILNNYLCNTI